MIYILEDKVNDFFCNKAVYFFKYAKWLRQKAKVTSSTTNNSIYSDIRRSDYVRLFPKHFWEETSYIYTLIYTETIKYFNFDFWPKLEDMQEDIKIIRYRKGDYFDWHYDMFHELSKTRKVNFTIQLSDETEYEGGDLEFFQLNVGNMKKKGSVIIYPSYLPHRITPITKGTRYAMVGHLNGPEFR